MSDRKRERGGERERRESERVGERDGRGRGERMCARDSACVCARALAGEHEH